VTGALPSHAQAATDAASTESQDIEQVRRQRDEALAQLAELRERLTQVERSCAQYEKLVALLQEADERLKRGLMGHT
jgi:chromosome segregation ATPase